MDVNIIRICKALVCILCLSSCMEKNKDNVINEIKELSDFDCEGFSSGEKGYVDKDSVFINYTASDEVFVTESLDLPVMGDGFLDEISIDGAPSESHMESQIRRYEGFAIEDLKNFNPSLRAKILFYFISSPYYDYKLARLLWSSEEKRRNEVVYKLLQGGLTTQAHWWAVFRDIGEVRGLELKESIKFTSNRDRIASRIILNCRILRSVIKDDERWLSLLKQVKSLDRGVVGKRIYLKNTLDYPIKVILVHSDASPHSKRWSKRLAPGERMNSGPYPGVYIEEFPHFNNTVESIEISSNQECNKTLSRDDLADHIEVITREEHGPGYVNTHSEYQISLARLCGIDSAKQDTI
jgi:hypothetical protein